MFAKLAFSFCLLLSVNHLSCGGFFGGIPQQWHRQPAPDAAIVSTSTDVNADTTPSTASTEQSTQATEATTESVTESVTELSTESSTESTTTKQTESSSTSSTSNESTAKPNSPEAVKFGCKTFWWTSNSYCWRSCNNTSTSAVFDTWCFTSSNSNAPIQQCDSDADCAPEWECNGSCGIISPIMAIVNFRPKSNETENCPTCAITNSQKNLTV